MQATFAVQILADQFLGTGILASPRHVATCDYVVTEHGSDELRPDIQVRINDDALVRVADCQIDENSRIAILRLEQSVTSEPVRFVKGVHADLAREIVSQRLEVYGFEAYSERQLRIADLRTINLAFDSVSTPGTLADLQFEGGILAGMGGGPIVIRRGGEAVCMGMIYLGGSRAATSRAVPSDRIIDSFQRANIAIQTVDARSGVFRQHLAATPEIWAQFYSVFISYSHQDKVFAKRLTEALKKRGIRCWLDEHQMLPGDDIYQQVERGIMLWDKMLLCASRDSLSSWWVDNELETVFEKERLLMKERGEKVLALIPLDLDGFLFSDHWKGPKAKQVKSRFAADFSNWETEDSKFDSSVETVVCALRADDGAREDPPHTKL